MGGNRIFMLMSSQNVFSGEKKTAILRSPLIFLVFVLGLHLLRQVNHLLPWDSGVH